MKQYLLTYLIVTFVGLLTVQAQINPNRTGNRVDQYGNQIDPTTQPNKLDSDNVEVQSLPPKLFMWRLNENLGTVNRITIDTIVYNFQNINLTEGMTGHYNHLSNNGSPRLSRIFFERREAKPTIFVEPYSFFFIRPDELNFTNSNVPYTNLSYYKAGNRITGEERFKSYFSVNVNKQMAFGFIIDYLYGRGYYNNNGISHFNATPFLSYMGDRYEASLIYSYNHLKVNQNGGITDDRYITRPEDMTSGGQTTESVNIPTVLNAATSRTTNKYLFLTHRYKLGFHRDLPKAANDTLPPQREFVPVTSFIHTLKIEQSKYRFDSSDTIQSIYSGNYLNKSTNVIADSTKYLGIKNTFGIALLEGFNKYAKAGLTAYISHKYSHYTLLSTDSTSADKYTEHEVYIGGELSKRQGNALHFRAQGEVGILDKAVGQFRINGDIDLNFRLGKDTVNLIARAAISNNLPDFYIRHYHSKHFYWDNDLTKETRTRLEGEVNIGRWGTNLRAGVESIKNYTFFNDKALPEQQGDNIQVLSATLTQNFQVGILHLDNEITWQKSSNKNIIPLPDLSLYHNLYIDTRMAKKVLHLQLGADVRYFTKYYAPAYMAATGQFHLQAENDRVEIGNYPVVSVYANLHLKRTRFYVMFYHINEGWGKKNYFYAPHYPINPRAFKFGISWNLFD